METLYQLTDLEVRIQLNLNVLDKSGSPKIMSLGEAITSWINHRREILIRITENSLYKTNNRLEVLESFLIVYLNLDEVISIIREDNNPKNKLMKRFKISEYQSIAILDMKLRNLRKLEEKQIIIEKNNLLDKKIKLEKLLKYKKLQWKEVKSEISTLKVLFKNELLRKTKIENKNVEYNNDISLKIEKELITVIVSKKGWIKSIKGHSNDLSNIKFKEGDELSLYIFLNSLDDLLLFADNGRFYNVPVYKLPSGRGFGEPLSIIFDDIADANILYLSNSRNEKLVLVSSNGKGFSVSSNDVISKRKTGKQIMYLKGTSKAIACLPINGDMIAIVGENRKLLIFEITEIPELNKGQGVILQRYKDGKCSDAKIISSNEGLYWKQGKDRTRHEKVITVWLGKRGGTGKMPPRGFPKPPKFF